MNRIVIKFLPSLYIIIIVDFEGSAPHDRIIYNYLSHNHHIAINYSLPKQKLMKSTF